MGHLGLQFKMRRDHGLGHKRQGNGAFQYFDPTVHWGSFPVIGPTPGDEAGAAPRRPLPEPGTTCVEQPMMAQTHQVRY
jgi:hypothetical protein